jgi:hypothetical protein
MNLVAYHWSGKHRKPVRGINLLTCVWTEGTAIWPIDYSIKDPASSLTKNEVFRQILQRAAERGFQPECVAFDSWFSAIDNLKMVRQLGWRFLTRLKTHRLVSLKLGE